MKILLITDSSYNNLIPVLNPNGLNTIEVRTTNQVNSGNYSPFDIIVITNITNGTTLSTTFISLVNSTKAPVLIGYVNYNGSGVGVSANNALGMLGLASSCSDPGGRNYCTVTDDNHPIMKDNVLPTGTVFLAYGSTHYMTTVSSNNLVANAQVLCTSAGDPTAVFFPKGITTLSNVRLESEVIFLGFLNEGPSLSEISKRLVQSSLEYLFIKPYQVAGKVTDSNQQPLQRVLYVMEQDVMSPLSKVTSDINGNYKFLLKENTPVSIICTPLNTNNNAQIRHNIIPELRTEE